MQIGELSARSGVPAKTIRYYEDIGVIPPPRRSPSGYRQFDQAALDRLAFVRAARAVGLSLGEIRGVVALRDGGETPCAYVVELLVSRSAELDRRIAEMRGLRGELHRLVDRAQGLDPAECDPRAVCHVVNPNAASGGSSASLPG